MRLMVHSDTGKQQLAGARYDVDTISLLGGHLALDFANTIEDRISDWPDDTLRTPDDLRRWGVRLGVLEAKAPATAAELAQAVELRKHLLGLFSDLSSGRRLSKRDANALARAVAQAHADATLTQASDGSLSWSWNAKQLATVRHAVANSALELLNGPMTDRIHQCANHDCGWFFLDTSKNASRHWCSMRGCGNLAKTRRRRNR
jgi:predicted RNA-binding Zn ribbon-like protein